MIQVEDTAYVSFGWWLNAMGTDGDYEFDAFTSCVMEMIWTPDSTGGRYR